GHWVQPARRWAQGPMPKPRWMPQPQLLYAQVVKQYRRRRLVGMRHRVVFGSMKAVKQVLASQGWQINTAFIERVVYLYRTDNSGARKSGKIVPFGCMRGQGNGTDPFFLRVNLSIRQHVAAVGRRVMTLCKHADGLRQQLALYHLYYNFCLP